MPTLSRVFWSGLWWSLVGAVAGAFIGLALGLSGWGLPGTSDTVAIQVASWAMFLHVVGALVGCYAALDTGDRFSRKPDHHDRAATLIRVLALHAEESERARQILMDAGGVDQSLTTRSSM
jgi:hypothetical protein